MRSLPKYPQLYEIKTGGARRCPTLRGELWVREPVLDIHQAEGGADVYWWPEGASFEGACAGVGR